MGIAVYVYRNFKIRKLQVACGVPLVAGLKVRQKHVDRRSEKRVMEFFLSNHPLDCPICDQGGGVIYKISHIFTGRQRKVHEDYKRAVVGFRVVR